MRKLVGVRSANYKIPTGSALRRMGLNDARPFTRADVPILTFLVVGAVLDSGTELRKL